MGETCSTGGGDEKSIQHFNWKKLSS